MVDFFFIHLFKEYFFNATMIKSQYFKEENKKKHIFEENIISWYEIWLKKNELMNRIMIAYKEVKLINWQFCFIMIEPNNI